MSVIDKFKELLGIKPEENTFELVYKHKNTCDIGTLAHGSCGSYFDYNHREIKHCLNKSCSSYYCSGFHYPTSTNLCNQEINDDGNYKHSHEE